MVERDGERILFRARRHNNDEFRITLGTYNGRPVVQARDWYEVQGEWRPGKKGISLPVAARRHEDPL